MFKKYPATTLFLGMAILEIVVFGFLRVTGLAAVRNGLAFDILVIGLFVLVPLLIFIWIATLVMAGIIGFIASVKGDYEQKMASIFRVFHFLTSITLAFLAGWFLFELIIGDKINGGF